VSPGGDPAPAGEHGAFRAVGGDATWSVLGAIGLQRLAAALIREAGTPRRRAAGA